MSPAPVLQRYSAKKALIPIRFRFGGGVGGFEHDPKKPDICAVMTNGDDRFGYLMPGPRETVDMPGIAAGYRVVAQCKHNDVNCIATTNSTDSKIYREETATVRQFTAATSEYFTIADNEALSTGNIDFTFAIWVRADTSVASRGVMSKSNATGNQREYGIDTSSSLPRFVISSDGTGGTVVTLTSTGSALAIDTWYLIIVWHDATANTLNIQVNNGAVDSVAHTLGVFDSTAAFQIGRNEQAGLYWNGRIGPTGFWKAVLTSAERTALYNNGVPLRSGHLVGLGITTPTSYWNMDEASGDAIDSVGANNLTDTNTVTTAAANYNYWAIKQTVTSAVATWIGSFHDGTDSICAVGMGINDAFRYTVDDWTNIVTSTLTGTKKNITYAFVQQDGLVPRVVYVVDPDEVYFANSLDNSATVSTAENVGSGNTTDDYFTSITPDDQGNLMIGKRHVLYRRMVLSDDSVNYEIVSPYYDDNLGDAGGQSDRRNFENPVNLDGRVFYPVNGYTLGMWYQGRWRSGLEPREAGPRIPRLDLPINALARAGRWLVLALGSKNTATLKTMTNAPAGTNLLQNTFATVSELYLGEIVGTPNGDAIRWHGSVLTCTDPLRHMWFDEDDSYLYLASGDSETIDLQQRRALVYTDDPLYHTVSSVVTLNNGTVTCEFGRFDAGVRGRKLLRHASMRTTGLTTAVTAELKYRNEAGRNPTGAMKTHATYTTVEKAARGTMFPTSRTFEEAWAQLVLTGSINSYATVEEVELLVEVLG